MKKRIDLKVAIGRYVPSERHDIQDKVVDEIVIDSAFSPVRLVNYFVEILVLVKTLTMIG